MKRHLQHRPAVQTRRIKCENTHFHEKRPVGEKRIDVQSAISYVKRHLKTRPTLERVQKRRMNWEKRPIYEKSTDDKSAISHVKRHLKTRPTIERVHKKREMKCEKRPIYEKR